MSSIKYVEIKELREKGYLFELNRQFLHPLGLALEVKIDEQGNECLGGIWDYRDNPEGMMFDNKTVKSDEAIKKAKHVEQKLNEKAKVRLEKYGYVVQPIGQG